ncbi:MAG: hypothetical protein V8R46_08475 [Eubacterium ramulus]
MPKYIRAGRNVSCFSSFVTRRKTQSEVAKLLGTTQVQISRREEKPACEIAEYGIKCGHSPSDP